MISKLKLPVTVGFVALCLSSCASTTDQTGGQPSYMKGAQAAAYDSEIQIYQAEYAADENNLGALLNLARSLRYAGYPENAVKALNSGKEMFADHPAWMIEYGKAKLAAGDFKTAKRVLQDVVTQVDNWEAYSALGIIHDYEEDYPQAMNAYMRASALCPESASIMNNMGISAAMSGDLPVARNLLTKAAALRPQSRRINKNLELFRKIEIRCPDCTADEIHDIMKGVIVPQDWGYADLACTTAAQDIIDALSKSDFYDVKVHFEFDKATLTPEAIETLTSMAQAFNSRALMSHSFILEGHTDAVGTDEYNMDLSRRRAAAVEKYLVEVMGISAHRLSSAGYGESRLVDPDHPTSGVNRRVRIVKQ